MLLHPYSARSPRRTGGPDGPGRQDSPVSGFTLVETAMSAVLLGVFMVALGLCLSASHSAQAEMSALATVDDLARRVMDRMSQELRFAARGSLDLTEGVPASSVTFSPVSGWNGSASTTGASRTIAASGGVVTVDGTTLAEGVTALTFEVNGNLLTVLLQINRSFTALGNARTVSRQLTLELRLSE